MTVEAIRMNIRNIAEELWALQHTAYRAEAALIGVAVLPPLFDTVETLMACRERFYGWRTPEGELAGAISCETESAERHTICRLMVHPEYHRQGIGSKLLSHVLALEPAAVWTVTAEVRNTPALKLYERAGFIRKGTVQPAPDIMLVQLERLPVET